MLYVFSVVLSTAGCHSVLHSLACDDSVTTTASSPRKAYSALAIQEDCGATEHATVVTVRRNKWIMRRSANVFVAAGLHDVRLSWRNDNALAVDCLDCYKGDTYTADKQWNEVSITYNLPASALH